MERWQPRPLNGGLRGRVHDSEFPSWWTSHEGIRAFASILYRHTQEQVRAIVAALPANRQRPEYTELALAYDRFLRNEALPLFADIQRAVFTGPWDSYSERLRRAAQTHNQFVDRFRGIGVEPALPDSEAADPSAGSWKPWLIGGMVIAGVGALGYLLVSAARAKQALGMEGASTMPPLQSFAGARHALRSGTRRVPRKALRGYNLEVEPQHR